MTQGECELVNDGTDQATTPTFRIRLLGPVELWADGSVHGVPGVRRRTVLAALALHRGEVVNTDRLIDIVWGDRTPRTAVNTLQSHVSCLRRRLGPRAPLLARSNGYVLAVPDGVTDVALAEQLVQRAATAAPADAVRHLEEALALWRGTPLSDVAASSWAEDQAGRLAHLRLSAHKALARARLALPDLRRLVADLEPLTREHPLDEQLHEYLMLALYREGLQSRSLLVFERLRTALREELGIHPSRALRDLHAAILRQDEPC